MSFECADCRQSSKAEKEFVPEYAEVLGNQSEIIIKVQVNMVVPRLPVKMILDFNMGEK